ncbi:response regulator receiver domain [Mesorhizobium sp. RCC_202]|uniref:response regulator receiver domain n=1 Tax=Mesorhizobium sp. RCC_202 TaxID=3239222 RepID=UPI003525C60B
MTSVQEFALTAARKYLQSVVFVDDEIYQQVPVTAVKANVGGAVTAMRVYAKPREPKVEEVIEPLAAGAPDEQNEEGDSGALYHPKHLVESFARERMVCALYEPKKDFSTGPDSELFKLCERADVVILDWEFHREPGKKVMELVTNLVTAAQTTVPHHVRLCAIYTSTPNLKHVASQLFDHLKGQQLEIEADGDYNISAGSSRIIVLGKPSTGRPKDQETTAGVAEAHLAERIIKEFATMHEGILPSMALHGLASVRTNTKKILDKFRKEMDGAFLAHRGLILPGDDAFEQVPELLAEEAFAVMVDNRIKTDQAKKLAEKAIDALDVKTAWPTKGNAAVQPGELAVKLLKEGPAKVSKKVDLNGKALGDLYNDLDKGKASAKERLAALYTSRTQYGHERALEFGTIVRYAPAAAPPEYAICLMPLCDCVRLKQADWYQFPFWKLRVDNSGASAKGLVVELPAKAGFAELFSMGKPRDQLWLEEFQAGAAKMVMAEKDGDGFVFKGKSKPVEWIAQLKPSHAQRIAQDIGTSFSRIGVLEAEWLRLKADRQS